MLAFGFARHLCNQLRLYETTHPRPAQHTFAKGRAVLRAASGAFDQLALGVQPLGGGH